MEKLKMIMVGIAVSFLMMLDTTSLSSQNIKYNPFYYPELSGHADSMQVDFSAEYKRWLIPDKSQTFKDITNDILQKGYTFERSLFCTERFIYEGTDGRSLYFEDTSFDGILGDRYARIEIYINPEVERTDSLTFRVKGKSKVKKNICDFTGEIRIEHIYNIWERADDPDSPDYYLMVCNYLFKEDKTQYGTGFFQGTYGVYCHIDKAGKKVCLYIDMEGGDGYNNRNYVGIWQSYKTKAVKKCIWGEYRLPYTFDFDIGDGEMRVNPKYASPEWGQWQSEYLHEVRKVCWWTESPGKTQDSGENFLDFIEKFHGDTLFQKRRVAEVISGYNSNDDEIYLDDESSEKTTQYAWDRDEAISYLIFLNYERIKPEYEISFDIKSNCNAVEDIVIPQSSCFYSLGFSLINCEWILTSLTVNEL